MFDIIIIRYGELNTKGRNRPTFIKYLLNNIKKSLENFPDLTFKKKYDYILINFNHHQDKKSVDKIISILKTIFGISSFSLAIKTKQNFDIIVEKAITVLKYFQPKSFKIEVKRYDKNYEYDSSTFKKMIATKILSTENFSGNLINPDLRITIEIRKTKFYLRTEKIIGAKGLPVGSAGKILLLMSGGIDSPVAAYLLMKRGLEVHYLHFYSPPHTTNAAWDKVKKLVTILENYQPNKTLVFRCNFTPLQSEISHIRDQSYKITIMRRFFMRIACQVATKNKILLLATGDSLGQVASQTIESLNTISNAANLVILRPLITYDKEEIINLAQNIKTYETSILPFDDCCSLFVPKNPVTKPRIYFAEKLEREIFVNELLDSVIDNVEIVNI